MSKIFGGSKQSGSSSNRAYGDIRGAMNPLLGNAGTGANALQALLSGDTSGLDAYKDATGFDFAAEQGSRGITGNAAAGGLLRSGSTGKALQSFGQNINQQFAGNYMDRLLQQANLGFSAANAMAGAGNVQQQSSKSKPGLSGLIGGIASGVAASDPRLKTDIVRIGDYGDVGLYAFKYKTDEAKTPKHIGVMADEVEKAYPEALGPTNEDGYMTVDYDKLKELVGA